MQWIERHADADERQVGSRLVPLGADETIDERLGNGSDGEHAHCRDEHRHLDDFPICYHHTLRVVLYLAEGRIADPLDYAGQVGREDIGVLLASAILPQRGGAIELGYDGLVKLIPDIVQHSAEEQLPPKAPHIL